MHIRRNYEQNNMQSVRFIIMAHKRPIAIVTGNVVT